MKRTLFLFAIGLALGAVSRWATSPYAPLPATPEAWPQD
jgi:hypothetical protein